MKWWKWLLFSVFVISGVGVTFFLTSTPIFSHTYQQLTERVEIGVKYTNPEKEVIYIQPYIENPNDSSDLTLTHSQNFIEVSVLDESRKTLEEAVVRKQTDNSAVKVLNTTLAPGEVETTRDYYKLRLPQNARWIQLNFSGEVDDEFGTASINKMVEVDIEHLHF